MPKQPKEKSAHLQELEAVFDRQTRRFSPFNILGLRSNEVETEHPEQERETEEQIPSTHRGVDTIHPHVPPTHQGVDDTPVPDEWIHTKVVEVINQSTTTEEQIPSTHRGVDATHRGVPPTHQGVDGIHPHRKAQGKPFPSASTGIQMHEVLAATQIKAQLGKKARQVLGYLNNIRSLERPGYTVPVGYAQISAAADVHIHYLRRNVLPKLAMIGLIGIVHKSFQGTIYHLHYDVEFFHILAGEEDEPLALMLPRFLEASPSTSQPLPFPAEPILTLPTWVDREHWGWLTPEIVQQLIAKAGSEVQAQEKLEIVLYNELHGPVERRVRDRRAVLTYYLRTPQADIWPNDDGFETLALQHARQERAQALQEKALAEEALQIRQEAAKARFLVSLDDSQLQWLKQEAKQRVDAQSSARFLTSRYPLYKAEEERLIHEWMDRINYGETVPCLTSGRS